jgi:hypothetical protein
MPVDRALAYVALAVTVAGIAAAAALVLGSAL